MKKPIVLIVEDEAFIRLNAVFMVEDAGFSPVDVCNADDAIAVLECRDDIYAVFTDIRMPGSMDGLKLAHAIKGRWPSIHLIVTSSMDARDQMPETGRFVPKPYTADHVVAALRKPWPGNPDEASPELKKDVLKLSVASQHLQLTPSICHGPRMRATQVTRL